MQIICAQIYCFKYVLSNINDYMASSNYFIYDSDLLTHSYMVSSNILR